MLTRATLAADPRRDRARRAGFDGPLTVYGEQSRLTAPHARARGVTFKQTPYDVKARPEERLMKLKQYQADTLAVLRRFLEEARVVGAEGAYEAITREPEQAKRLGRYGGAYTRARRAAGRALCLPAAADRRRQDDPRPRTAIGIARDAWVEKDYPLVLWLVPSNTIRLQTVEALKNARHPYRQALDEAFDGRVRVFDIARFHADPAARHPRPLSASSSAPSRRCASTNTEGRKVYSHNENMEPHFTALPKTLPGLERVGGRRRKFSFANLLHIHRPLMIVDEAHNAVTGLTREMQARVNPSAIIEFTATPRLNSQHPAQRHGAGAEGRGDDQAADHAGRARHLAERGQRRDRGRASLAEEAEKDDEPTSARSCCSRRSRRTRR